MAISPLVYHSGQKPELGRQLYCIPARCWSACLYWRGLMNSLITNAKLLSLGFILNYISVQSTPHGHTSQSIHLYSNSCCENQLPTVYLRSRKLIKLMWIIAIIRHTEQKPETTLLLISSCEFPVQISPRCRRKRKTIGCFKVGNESYALGLFWSSGSRGFLSDHIFVFCSK